MKQLLKIATFMITILYTVDLWTLDSIITLFIQKYPYASKAEQKSASTFSSEKYSKKLKQPDYVYRKISKSPNKYRHHIPGIMCLYAGRAEMSNPEGQITFPRRQQTPNMHILITEGIKPAYIVAPATVHNWVLDPAHPAEMYLMELKYDPTSTLHYYQTTKIDVPADQNIPLNTIIFIANPKNMYIPLGATIVDYSPNIILPTIYIKKGFCFVYNSLYTLAVNQYFEPTQKTYKQDGSTIAEIQQIH